MSQKERKEKSSNPAEEILSNSFFRIIQVLVNTFNKFGSSGVGKVIITRRNK